MSFLAPLITFFYEQFGNFGWAIIITVLIAEIVMIPLSLLKARNKKKERIVQPEIKKLREKYNASFLGVSQTDDEKLPEELRGLTVEERDDRMAEESRAIYKRAGYHAFIGYLPAVFFLISVIILYSSIRAATPTDSVYAETIKTMSCLFSRIVLFLPLFLTMCSYLLTLVFDARKRRKRNESGAEPEGVEKAKKENPITSILGGVVTIGLMTWVTFNVNVATAFAMAFLNILAWAFKLVIFVAKKIISKGKAPTNEASGDIQLDTE